MSISFRGIPVFFFFVFFEVLPSDIRKRQLNCLRVGIPGVRRAPMFLADDNWPAVPGRTKHSDKRFIIVHVWLNKGSTTPASQARIHHNTKHMKSLMSYDLLLE